MAYGVRCHTDLVLEMVWHVCKDPQGAVRGACRGFEREQLVLGLHVGVCQTPLKIATIGKRVIV